MCIVRKKKSLTELTASLTHILFPAELFKSIKNVLIHLGQTHKQNSIYCPFAQALHYMSFLITILACRYEYSQQSEALLVLLLIFLIDVKKPCFMFGRSSLLCRSQNDPPVYLKLNCNTCSPGF